MDKSVETGHEVFKQLRAMPLEPSPYLKTRVLAEVASRRRARRSVFAWKAIAAASVAFSLGLLVFLRPAATPGYEARVGQAFAVRIEVEPLRKYEVAEAEIDLPRGVEFYSKEFPALNERKSLKVAWNAKSDRFPVVLRAVEPGRKTVKVLFFDRDHNLVTERTFNINLKEAS